MADHSVDVVLEPDGSLTFTPNPVRVTASGKIVLHKQPRGADWRFAEAGMVEQSDQFEVTIPPDRRTVTIVDRHTSFGEFGYWVRVESPDGRTAESRRLNAGARRAADGADDVGGDPPVVQNEPETTIKKKP